MALLIMRACATTGTIYANAPVHGKIVPALRSHGPRTISVARIRTERALLPVRCLTRVGK
jgi:hypothetical protein